MTIKEMAAKIMWAINRIEVLEDYYKKRYKGPVYSKRLAYFNGVITSYKKRIQLKSKGGCTVWEIGNPGEKLNYILYPNEITREEIVFLIKLAGKPVPSIIIRAGGLDFGKIYSKSKVKL